jgi:hypothetical protein
MRKITPFLLFVFLCVTSLLLHADEQSQADAAVANILFEYDGSEEFATYKVNDDGSVDLIFASNTPDNIYEELLTKLQNHPHISSVLASKGGPVCKLF